jgi:hypothetical protein
MKDKIDLFREEINNILSKANKEIPPYEIAHYFLITGAGLMSKSFKHDDEIVTLTIDCSIKIGRTIALEEEIATKPI